jgi:hypothetical protein
LDFSALIGRDTRRLYLKFPPSMSILGGNLSKSSIRNRKRSLPKPDCNRKHVQTGFAYSGYNWESGTHSGSLVVGTGTARYYRNTGTVRAVRARYSFFGIFQLQTLGLLI